MQAVAQYLKKPIISLLAALLLAIPLLFTGTRHSHDWGDDFAQYIHQAGNIVHGIPQSETGFVYSQLNYIGPQAYPGGFPLLLAPVYALAGNSMMSFIFYMSLWYMALAILLVLFYRQHFQPVAALVLMAVFIYNPQMLLFKREVMSDVPFTALLLLNLLLYEKHKESGLNHYLLLALTTGIMLCIRPAGIVFVAALLADRLAGWLKQRRLGKLALSRMAILTLVPLIIYFLVNNVLLHIPSGGSIRDYLSFYFTGGFLKVIPGNFAHYIEVFRFQYVPESGALKGFSYLLGAVMVAFAAAGFVQQLLKGLRAVDWFFIFYVLMLLVFPNYDSAFRLMIPLGFILLMYAACGLKGLKLISERPGGATALAAGLTVLLLYLPGIAGIVRWGFNTLEGPQKKESVEVFEFIRANVPADSVVVFAKPRALALYGGCRSMTDPLTEDPTLVHNQLTANHAAYILVNQTLTRETMNRYVRMMGNRLAKQFENRDFTLYRINRAAPR